MASTESIYQPRHAGQNADAARRSRIRRAQVDLDRAFRLLDSQWQAGDTSALLLRVKLSNPHIVGQLVSA